MIVARVEDDEVKGDLEKDCQLVKEQWSRLL